MRRPDVAPHRLRTGSAPSATLSSRLTRLGTAETSRAALIDVFQASDTIDIMRRKIAAGRYVVRGVIFVGVLVGSACTGDGERSVEAFCSMIKSEKERILDQFDASSSAGDGDEFGEVLAGLGASIQGIGELRTYTRKLAAVAPDEIRVEAELMAESMDDQLDAAQDGLSDPLGALGSSLFAGLAGSGPTSAVDDFAWANCGEGI